MEKVSTTLRRSTVRLRSSLSGAGGNHADLQMIIEQFRDVKACQKVFCQSELAAWQDLAKWGQKEDNIALQDVLCQAGELALSWNEVQHDMTHSLREFKQRFEMVLEGEKCVNTAKAELESAEAKEDKLKRELKKGTKKPLAMDDLYQKLEIAERERKAAKLAVMEATKEHEIIKMMRVKDALNKLSQSYMDMAKKCMLIFEAQQVLAKQIPDVEGGQSLSDLKYEGSPVTGFTVARTKEQLEQMSSSSSSQRRSITTLFSPESSFSSLPGELPPPYSPPQNQNFSNLSMDEHFDSREGQPRSRNTSNIYHRPGHSNQSSHQNSFSSPIHYPNLENLAQEHEINLSRGMKSMKM